MLDAVGEQLVSRPRLTQAATRNVLEAAFGVVGKGGEPPQDLYFNGRVLVETGEESRDAAKRAPCVGGDG